MKSKADRSAVCANLWKLQARMTYSAVPSSLKMKHGANKKTQRKVAGHKLVPCLRKKKKYNSDDLH
jgi:hypothetical protein